jgi:hypothetical protein
MRKFTLGHYQRPKGQDGSAVAAFRPVSDTSPWFFEFLSDFCLEFIIFQPARRLPPSRALPAHEPSILPSARPAAQILTRTALSNGTSTRFDSERLTRQFPLV